MLTYKVSDIVKQAKSKADLTNSDFITHEDDIILLNDAWIDLYQKAINAGEKYWITPLLVNNGHEVLPDDFFELESIYTEKGQLIARRKPNEHKTNDGYEIKNGEIFVYCDKPVIVNYWRKPETLVFPAADIKFTLPEPVKAVKKGFVYSDHYATNIETKETIKYNTIEDAELQQAFDDYIVIKSADTFKIYDRETLEYIKTIDIEDVIPSQKMGGELVFINPSTGDVYDWESESVIDSTAYVSVLENDILAVYQEETHSIYYTQGKYNYWLDEDTICYTDLKGFIKSFNNATGETKTMYSQRGFLLEENEKTGYGIFHNNTLKTISDDVILNYPSHLYYSCLSYRLAMNYKVKQNEDATSLQTLYEDSLITYFDTLQQDINESVRIKNVYGF